MQSHWVRVLALDERDGQVMDPWQMPGKELVKLSKYLAADWDAARGIFEVAFYRKVGGTGGPPSTKEPEARSHSLPRAALPATTRLLPTRAVARSYRCSWAGL